MTVEPQGSYFNNTNVRHNADQDLRAVHPLIRVEHDNRLNWQTATGYLGTRDSGRSFGDVVEQMRTEIDGALVRRIKPRHLWR